VLLGLVALGLGRYGVAIAGGVVAVGGFGLRGATLLRAQRLGRALRGALQADDPFLEVASVLERNGRATWAGLVSWAEHGLTGAIEREHGTGGPTEAALVSWLVRDSESGGDVAVAFGFALGRDDVVLALPLRRENSALVGFLALATPRSVPAHVELALRDCLDGLGLGLATHPSKPETIADPAVAAV
jgi:hypothetical protein